MYDRYVSAIKTALVRCCMSLFRRLNRKIHGPRCHLSPDEKAWVERRMTWMREQFGSKPIRRTPLDPTSDALPKQWNGSCEAGADLFKQLCGFMLVDPARLTLRFYSRSESHDVDSDYAGESHSSGPAGLYVTTQYTFYRRLVIPRYLLTEPNLITERMRVTNS